MQALQSLSSRPLRVVLRVLLSCISAVGVVLLVRMILMAAGGELVLRMLPDPGLHQAWWSTALALALGLPVPLHVIAVGMILQKPWLSPVMARVAWIAIVTSGCWLGVALLVRALLR